MLLSAAAVAIVSLGGFALAPLAAAANETTIDGASMTVAKAAVSTPAPSPTPASNDVAELKAQIKALMDKVDLIESQQSQTRPHKPSRPRRRRRRPAAA
jgi:hypothetical protein